MSVGWGVALVSAAATQTVVETFADSTANAADDASNQEEDNCSNDSPDPPLGTAFSGNSSKVDASKRCVHGSVLVAVGHHIKTSTVLNTHSSPPPLEEPLNLFLGIVGSLVDVIIDVQEVPVG